MEEISEKIERGYDCSGSQASIVELIVLLHLNIIEFFSWKTLERLLTQQLNQNVESDLLQMSAVCE